VTLRQKKVGNPQKRCENCERADKRKTKQKAMKLTLTVQFIFVSKYRNT
jgi:hypothetical protein